MTRNIGCLICSAFTFIQVKGSFEVYCGLDKDDLNILTLKQHWDKVVSDYETVSEYMNDEAITQAQSLVIHEF